MDWLKDKKNLPIVTGLLSTVLIASILFILYQAGVIGGSSTPDVPQQVAETPIPPPGVPPGASGAPGVPPVNPAAPGAAPAPGATPAKVAGPPKPPNYRQGPDPFFYKEKVAKVASDGSILGGLSAIPGINISTHTADVPQPISPLPTPIAPAQAPLDTTPRRVSGLMFSNGIYAILETNGESRTVQPGDNVDGARVISIQPDGLTLRTNDNRTVHVPLSSVQTGAGTPTPTDFNNPGGGPPPGFDPNQ